jgi:hypothetical protein
LELAISARERWEVEGREAAEAARAAREAHAGALSRRDELGFEKGAYEDALREHERAESDARSTEVALGEARAEGRAARERLAAAERAL